jgi:hypothetical protein
MPRSSNKSIAEILTPSISSWLQVLQIMLVYSYLSLWIYDYVIINTAIELLVDEL